MGLCKCRVVTSLFCFQHTENVCENCIVKDHRKCMIKSYLQWLQDADFTTKCTLCQQEIDNGEDTIRLPCYDVFHIRCIKNYVLSHAASLADADLKCPQCHAVMVPDAHNMSPVAKEARELLQPILAKRGKPKEASVISMPQGSTAAAPAAAVRTASPPPQHKITTSGPSHLSPMKRRDNVATGRDVVKRVGRGSESDTANGAGAHGALHFDTDADKYARRPANAWFAQVVGNRFPARKNASEPSLRRAAILLIIGVIFLFTVIHLLTKVHVSSDDDPLLNPMMNPNIQTEDSR